MMEENVNVKIAKKFEEIDQECCGSTALTGLIVEKIKELEQKLKFLQDQVDLIVGGMENWILKKT